MLGELVFGFDAHHGFVGEEVGEHGVEVARGLLLVSFLKLRLVLTEHVGLGALIFRFGEAEFLHAVALGDDGGEGFVDAILILGSGSNGPGILGVGDHEGAVITVAIDEGWIRLLGQFPRAVVEHLGNQVLYDVADPVGHVVTHFHRGDVVFVEDGDVVAGLFHIGGDAHDGLFVVGHGEVDALGWVDRSWDVGKHLFDAVLDLINVDVADDDDALEVGTVPFMIVVAKELMVEMSHHFLGTDDGHRGAVGTVGVDLGQDLAIDTHLCIQALTHLFQDDAALVLDLVVFKGDEARPVVQHEQAGVDESRVGGRDVVEHIDGLLETRPSVDVGTELHAVAFHVVEHGFLGEVLQAVEGHVLQEVCESSLSFLFQDGTHLLGDIEVGPLCRFLVVPDKVGESVVKFAYPNVGVNRSRHSSLGKHGNAQDQNSK